MARVIGIVGRKNAGKTTLLVALCRVLRDDGRRVMTIKHGHHAALVDQEGTDTWRHFMQGGAERTLIQSPDRRILFERGPDDYDPVGIVRRYMADADIVLAEGFARSAIPRIEVWRRQLAEGPILAGHDNPAAWVALVTDAGLTAPCPVIVMDEAGWMARVARLAWDGAMEVAP